MTPEKRAREITAEFATDTEPLFAMETRIASAIRSAELAVIERAAKIAETMGGDFIESDANGDGYREARTHIAKAIRSLAQTNGEG